MSVLWLNPGFFFVCRSEDNFKDNSPHCVLPSCSLFLSVFGFVLCFLCFFLFLTLFFWVDFFGSLFFLVVLGFLPPFIDSLATSFNQSCLCRTVIFPDEIVGERRGPRLDRLRCRSSACWIGMEKTNTAVPPATATFRQQWILSFWPLNFGNSAIGPLSN